MTNLFIPIKDGSLVITRDVTLAVTVEHMNNMSKSTLETVLNYDGDQSYWIEPTSWIKRWLNGETPNHKWCSGKMKAFASSGLISHTEHLRCNICGRTRSVTYRYSD